jgi:hypothetical protein
MEAPMTVRNYSLLAKLWRGVYTVFLLVLFSAAHAQSGFEQVGSFPGDSFEAMQLRGNYAYTTGSGVLLTIYDVSNMRRLYQLPAPSTDMFGYQVVLAGNYAYVLTAYKGRPGGAIKVVDVSNPSSPRVVGEYTGGSFDGLIVNGNIGYVSRGSQLHVLNLSNPATPQLIRTVTLSASLGGDGGTVVGNRLYLCESTAGLSVWDISQPDNPQRLGIIGNIGVARAVHVSGNYAFVAAGRWLGGIQGGLRVIDVSDPANMSMVNFVPEGNNPTAPLVRVDNYLYMPIFDPAQYSIVFDISNPASPQFAGSLDGQLGGADSSSNHAVSFRRSKLYLYDITNRNNPVLRSTLIGRTPYAIAYRAGFVFTAEDGLFGVYDVNNPASITGAGAAVLPGEPSYAPRVQVQDNLAVVSYRSGDLTKAVTLLDVSNPRNPSILSHYGANTNVEDIALTGNILFVAHVNGLDVVDISNRLSPTRVLRQSTSYSNHPVALDVGGVGGNLLYSADYDRKLRIYDVSNPASPVLRGEVEVASASYVADVAVSGDRAIVTLSNGDAVVVNVADPTQPQVVTRWDNPRETFASPRVHIADGIAYIADGSTLSAFDLSLLPVFSPVAQWQGSAYHAVSAGGLVFVAAGKGGLYALQRGTGGEFSVREVAPSQAAPVGTVRVNVFGGGFQDGATFRLERNGDRIDATDVQFVSAGQLAGTLNVDGKPDESVWDVVVRNPDGREARKGAAFLIAYPRPVVTGVSPTSAINVGQVELTVSGSNFEEGATFWLERDSERIDAVNVTRVDAARLRGTVDVDGKPENSLWDVVVRNPSGKTGRLPQAFTIQRAVPVIESVTPGQALPRSQTLTIRGRAFVSGARVEFRPFDTGLSPLAASAVQVSSQFEIQATFDFSAYRAPLGGRERVLGLLVVINPTGDEVTTSFRVVSPVRIDQVTPSSVVVNPDQPEPITFTVQGSFLADESLDVVLRAGDVSEPPTEVTRVSDTELRVLVSAESVQRLFNGRTSWELQFSQLGVAVSGRISARLLFGNVYQRFPAEVRPGQLGLQEIHFYASDLIEGTQIVFRKGERQQVGQNLRFGEYVPGQWVRVSLDVSTLDDFGAWDMVITRPDGKARTFRGAVVVHLPEYFRLWSISPQSGYWEQQLGNDTLRLTVSGSNLQHPVLTALGRLELRLVSGSTDVAARVINNDDQSLQAEVDISSLPNQTYDVIARYIAADGRVIREARLRQAFSMEEAGSEPIRLETLDTPTTLRANRLAAFRVTATNRLGVALSPQIVRIYVESDGLYLLGADPNRMYSEFWLLTTPVGPNAANRDTIPPGWGFTYNMFVRPVVDNVNASVAGTLRAEWISPRNPFNWDLLAANPPSNIAPEEWRQRVMAAKARIGNSVRDVLNYLQTQVLPNLPVDLPVRYDLAQLLSTSILWAGADPDEFSRTRGQPSVDSRDLNIWVYDPTSPNAGPSGLRDFKGADDLQFRSSNVYILTHGYGGLWNLPTGTPVFPNRDGKPTYHDENGVLRDAPLLRTDFRYLASEIKSRDPNAVVIFLDWDRHAKYQGIGTIGISKSGTYVAPVAERFASELDIHFYMNEPQKIVFYGESYGTYVGGQVAKLLSQPGNLDFYHQIYDKNRVYWVGCNPASEHSGQHPFDHVDKNKFKVSIALQTNSLADTQMKGFAHYHLFLKNTDKGDTVGLHTSGITAVANAIRNGQTGWMDFNPAFLEELEKGKWAPYYPPGKPDPNKQPSPPNYNPDAPSITRAGERGPELYTWTYDGTLDYQTGLYNPEERARVTVRGYLISPPVFASAIPPKPLSMQHRWSPPPSSWDPNEKAGSQGFGARNYINAGASIGYTIFFENVATATGAAQTVVITDRIDPALYDLSTFSFGPMWVSGRLINAPPSGTTFSTTVDLRPANNLLLRIRGNLDTLTGWIEWRFESLDPETGLPTEDPLAGFLPPNENPPQGEGWVTFSVRPKANLPDGTELRNTATIVFDENEPIQTNVVVHTIDAAPPTARVSALPETQSLPRFVVRWSGEDSGSGVAEYSVYYREDGGPWQQWIGATSRTEAVFVGRFGSSYEFKVRARDYLGNEEPDTDEPEAQTRVGQPPTIPAGLRLVTLPVFTESRDTRATLNTEPAQIAWFDPATNQYTIAPAAETVFQPGRAFWVRLAQDTQPNISGELPAMHQPFAVNLQPGWNLVGNPWLTEWEWNVQAIQVQHNGQTVSLNDASNLVEPYAWRWDGSQYQLVYDASILNGVTNRVQAWEGVWMFAQQPVRLLIAPPNTRAASSSRANRSEKPSWSVTLLAQAQGKVGQVIFGAAEGTRALSVAQPPSPPGGEAGLQIRLIRNGHPLLADVRTDTRSTRNTWEVEVQVPAGDDDRATLWWQNVHRAPRGVNPVLVDLQTGERRFLRHTSSHTFAVSRQGGTYRFRVEMVPQGELLRITNVRVSGGRSQGSYTLSFDVNAGAQLEVNVLSAGKVVRRLMNTITRSAGIQQVSWDGRDAQGIALPAGAYMLEVKATGTDGQVARVSVPVVLTR